MDPLFYKILHLIGLICIFSGLGAALASGEGRSHINRLVAILFGTGLLLSLVSGFGMVAKLKLGFPSWVIVKIVLWVAMAVMITVGKRTSLGPTKSLFIAIALGIVLALLGVYKAAII